MGIPHLAKSQRRFLLTLAFLFCYLCGPPARTQTGKPWEAECQRVSIMALAHRSRQAPGPETHGVFSP